MRQFSKRLAAVQSSLKEVKESVEGGQHYFRMESFELFYPLATIMVFLKESLGAWAACFLCEGVNPLI
jgi:hypothetical protein